MVVEVPAAVCVPTCGDIASTVVVGMAAKFELPK